ncbi:MAG: hypothetical protein KGS45_08275 [Planctomycetes bacterium]|nr:hypothetical protein [Planctomycetota bacterium]
MSTRDKNYMSASMVRTCLAAMGVMVAVSVASGAPVQMRNVNTSSSMSSCDDARESRSVAKANKSAERQQKVRSHHKHGKKHKPRRGK